MEAQEKPIVVVGVTESGSSRAALRLAAQEADYRGATLIAIMAYGSNPVLGAPAARPLATSHNADDERLVAESALRDAVADALGDQADRVQQLAVAGPTGRKLVEVAHTVHADLLVLAGHGTASVLPGSAGQYVLRKAPCPVLVVPDADRRG